MYVGLARLSVLDEFGHLCELSVGANPGGLDFEQTASVDSGSRDVVAEGYLDRYRFTG